MFTGQRRQLTPRVAATSLPIRRGNTFLPSQQCSSNYHFQYQKPNRTRLWDSARLGSAFGLHCHCVDCRVPEERSQEGACGASTGCSGEGMIVKEK